MAIIGDYHVHTNFCPHGSEHTIEQYIESAISLGLKEISFTEHAPLPQSFADPTPEKDSAMSWDDLSKYIEQITRYKRIYHNKIAINLGFELDYIEGFEDEITYFLNDTGSVIDDSILSVHMLKNPADNYVCLDFSREMFAEIINQFGSVDKVYEEYYRTLQLAIQADLGRYKPKRIGHITLIEKFIKKYPPENNYDKTIDLILDEIINQNLSLDINTAGLFKEDCKQIYPSKPVIQKAYNKGIPLIPGSDSHVSSQLTTGFNQLPADITFSTPHSKTQHN
ncbi:histidinol-phosphatase (PHP family) [Gracilibacillus ureilyticus]|uniref:Histidinol-phosphatase n=1 Tax=Gracilibacillus ureilyticus TaxID=531814 RepID=A0A1H9LF00_9BACI|nr:histidinol-phosphatase HisJ [Gracilibacillus ureilyticus]SER09819.1 histidinol-phosphatase (PHP family) [Gracilibacillus ureilyticus]